MAELEKNDIIEVIENTFLNHFPNSKVRCSIHFNELITVRCYLAKDNTEAINKIIDNDPLQLAFRIKDQSLTYLMKSIHKNPTNKYSVYSSENFKLRKTKFKNLNDLELKLNKAFLVVKNKIQELLEAGEFSVYENKFLEVLKSKL